MFEELTKTEFIIACISLIVWVPVTYKIVLEAECKTSRSIDHSWPLLRVYSVMIASGVIAAFLALATGMVIG